MITKLTSIARFSPQAFWIPLSLKVQLHLLFLFVLVFPLTLANKSIKLLYADQTRETVQAQSDTSAQGRKVHHKFYIALNGIVDEGSIGNSNDNNADMTIASYQHDNLVAYDNTNTTDKYLSSANINNEGNFNTCEKTDDVGRRDDGIGDTVYSKSKNDIRNVRKKPVFPLKPCCLRHVIWRSARPRRSDLGTTSPQEQRLDYASLDLLTV